MSWERSVRPIEVKHVVRRIARVSLLVVLLVLLAAPPGDARGPRGHGRHHHGHGRVFVGVGPWWGGPPYPYWYYPPPYPRVVVEEPPPVYIEQRSAEPDGYWYYCQSAQAYYPQAATCQEAWIKVPPRPE